MLVDWPGSSGGGMDTWVVAWWISPPCLWWDTRCAAANESAKVARGVLVVAAIRDRLPSSRQWTAGCEEAHLLGVLLLLEFSLLCLAFGLLRLVVLDVFSILRDEGIDRFVGDFLAFDGDSRDWNDDAVSWLLLKFLSCRDVDKRLVS